MPSISAPNLTLLRTTQHKTRLNLAVYQPATIWRTQVNGAQTQGTTSIVVDAPTVIKAPAKNYQVMFSAVGYGLNDLGETRWKSYAALTLTVGAHNTPLPNDTYVTVKEEIKPVAIHATLNASDVVFEDGNTAYTAGATGENLQYHPLARMGPPACAFIDPATGLATVNFASASTAIATGAALASYAWVFPHDVGDTGGPATSVAANPGAVTWSKAGQYYCSLEVTDNAAPTGKKHTTYRPVFIFDSVTVPYSQVEIESLAGDVTSGRWRASLKVWGAATEAEFPDNGMVVLFSEDWYGDTKTSIGGQWTNRENIVWTGYVRGGSVKKNAEYGYIEFDAESVSGVMANLEGLAATLTMTAGTPTGWHQLSAMTYNRAAFHVLTEHSTISQIADCYLSLLDFTRDTLDLPESSVFDQLQFNIATPTRGQCGCSAQGMFYLEENPQLIPLADRTHTNIFANSPAPNLASMSFADFRGELDLGRDVHDKVTAQVDFAAESTAAAAIYSLAPAVPWASGRGERISGIRADSQVDSNIFAGLFEGYRNNPYADVVLPLRGNYRICDTFPPEQVQITLTAAQNKRGIIWSNQRCWIKSINYEYHTGGVLLSTVVVEKDAYGYPGITGNYPASPPDWPPPTFPPIEPPVEPPPVVFPDMPGKGNLLYVSTHKGLAKCEGAYGTDGTDGTPVWTKMNGSGGGALGNVVIRWFNLDPFSVSGDHFTAGWAMTDDGLWRVTGLPAAPVWAQQLTYAQANTLADNPAGTYGGGAFSYDFAPSVRKAGFVAVTLCFNTGFQIPWKGHSTTTFGLIEFTIYSLDYGATWNCDSDKFVTYSGIIVGLNEYQYSFLNASFHLDNVYYRGNPMRFPVKDQTGAGNTTPQPTVYRVPGSRGSTFPDFSPGMASGYTGPPFNIYGQFYAPYCNNAGAVYPNDNRIYMYAGHSGSSSAGTGAIRRYTAAFNPVWSAGYTPPTSIAVGDAAMPVMITHLFSNMFNEDKAVAIDPSNIWLTSNLSTGAPPTWTRKASPAIGGRTLTPRYLFCVPIDSNLVYFTGSVSGTGSGMPCLTPDFGTTLVDISLFGTGGAFDTVMGLAADSDMDDSIIIIDYYKP